MNNILTAFKSMAMFASIYCFSKCVKTLLCGLCLIPVILLLHRALIKKSAVISCYLWILLVPMAFMGMSKLFYQKYFIYVTAMIAGHVKAWHGYVYFGVMLALFANFTIRNIALRGRLKKMPQINDTSNNSFGVRYLKSVRIYISDTDESPFSGGIVRPYIVMPRGVLKRLGKRDREVILCHELTHIKSGHILLLTVFKLLTFLWWINPLMYLCESLLKEDIELACDECTIACTDVTRREYGGVLFGMIAHLSQNTDIATASFIDRNDFHILKRRIKHISRKKSDHAALSRQLRAGAASAFIIVLLTLAFIIMTSYPRYTVIEEIYVYGEDLELIAYGTPAVCAAFQVEGKELSVDEEGFKRFLEEENVLGDCVYVSFGTVMKLPGMGGCGDVVMVNVEDVSDSFSLLADTIENDIFEIFLKYII